MRGLDILPDQPADCGRDRGMQYLQLRMVMEEKASVRSGLVDFELAAFRVGRAPQ